MRNRILELSIGGLQKDGLRFSVDSIAKELKVSKKTIYKYFPTKEDLAVAIYEKFYGEIEQNFISATSCEFNKLLDMYYRSFCMVREDLFNKYALNDSIRKLALSKHNDVRAKFRSALPAEGIDATVLIIDGVFEKLNGAPLTRDLYVKLERLI